ncbi:YihY/virulence factor BrkB family protein [Catalinimonas niigatensis]|uniref:YihY/virulence factor BrkB family protein n=1 Tax=Catalinimonas niigatensis TaxID=1397264 RepID=UPI0026669D3E|nr:YihY/virulence factor BrkB family protein [Catalinimonas niigatensis]WPP50161.1 YihY/virulence factor BrkB family protein [Catalinimonas niigatensis]
MSSSNSTFSMLKESFQEWQADDAFRQSASLAYYAIFSLPALLIIVINVASLVWSQQYIEQQVNGQLGSMLGQDAAQQIQTMISNSKEQGNSILSIIIGVATLIFGATGVFYQLQKSLNDAWEVEQDPDAGIKEVAKSRITALGLIIAIGFLLIVFLVVSTLLSALSGWIQQQLPNFPVFIFYILQALLSIGILTALFAAMFKVLPDVEIEWRSVWVGALVTAVLFVIGKFLIGFYIGKTDPGSTFGAAGSIIIILLWVYYSGLILIFGAEFTQVYARRNGHRLEPSSHARRNAEYRLAQLEKEQQLSSTNRTK